MTGSLQGQRRLRRWHRLVAMATSIQLLLWTLSGLFFAFVDIDYVRGHQFKVPASPVALDLTQFAVAEFDAQHLVVLSACQVKYSWVYTVSQACNGLIRAAHWRER